MTENSFFEGPADEPAQSRKSLLILGAVGGAVVLAAAGYFLLGGGGGSDSQAFAVIPHRVNPVIVVAKPTSKKPLVVPAASKVRLGRDPFLALYVPPVAAVAGAGTAKPTATSAPTTTTTTVVTPTKTTTTTTGPTGATPTGTSTPPAAPAPPPATPPASTKHRFTIFSITGSAGTGRARVSIDGAAPFTVHEGSIFGPNKEITITDIGLTVGVGEHVAFTLGEDPQPEMYAHESRLVP